MNGSTNPRSAAARAYVAFAGGGAKGLVHVGGQRALEQKVGEGALEILGYSGTSAGALIACLAASGVKSTEILGATSDETLIRIVHEVVPQIGSLTDLFGRGGWAAIGAVRASGVVIRALPAWLRWFLLGAIVLVAIIVTSDAQRLLGAIGALLSLSFWGLITASVIYLGMGLVRLSTLRHALSVLLKKRVFGDPGHAREVTFACFDGATGASDGRILPLLKVVSANISRRELRLFSCDTTPDLPVADAVCASVCIPFIFRPWRIDDERYVDGGIVSNFPAWPFDEERALDPDALTIGFQVGGPPGAQTQATAAKGPVFWPTAVFETALFGSRQLSVRAVGRAELITLPARLGLLDFDVPYDRAKAEVEDVTAFALARINDRLLIFPDLYRAACAQLRQETAAILQSATPEPAAGATPFWVRCGVAIPPAGFRHSLATRFGAGYEAFSDGSLLWPIPSSLAGRAWTAGETVFELDPLRRSVELTGPLDAALVARLPSDLAWSLRVPISTAKGRFLVVLVDGSQPLAQTATTEQAIDALVDRAVAVFGPIVARIEEGLSDG